MEEEKFIKKLREQFDFFDKDKNGTISKQELNEALSKLKVKVENQKYFRKKIDKDSDHTITWEEFKNFGLKKFHDLKLIFDEMDLNKDGKITIEEMRETCKKNKLAIDDKSIEEYFDRFDKNKDGTIDFDEFREMLFFIPHVKNVESVFINWKEVVAQINFGDPVTLEVPEGEKKSSTFLASFAAGGLAAAFSKTAIAPLERIKVMLQVSKERLNPVTLLKNIIQKEGIRGLFKGNFVHLLKSSPEKALKFGFYEQTKKFFQTAQNKETLSNTEIFISAAIANSLSVLILHPVEVIRTQLSVSTEIHSLSGIIKHISSHRTGTGLLSSITPFYRGLVPHLCSTAPSGGINLLSYEVMKRMVFGEKPEDPPAVLPLMAVGAASSLVADFLLYPTNVLKSRLIMKKNEDTLVSIVSGIIKHEGPRGFYKGFAVTLVKGVPSHAISFAVYEVLKSAFGFEAKKKHH